MRQLYAGAYAAPTGAACRDLAPGHAAPIASVTTWPSAYAA